MKNNNQIAKCNKPNMNTQICNACQRSCKSETNNYASFTLKKIEDSYSCDGYVSKRETMTLFDNSNE